MTFRNRGEVNAYMKQNQLEDATGMTVHEIEDWKDKERSQKKAQDEKKEFHDKFLPAWQKVQAQHPVTTNYDD
jgi:hypothetical protein